MRRIRLVWRRIPPDRALGPSAEEDRHHAGHTEKVNAVAFLKTGTSPCRADATDRRAWNVQTGEQIAAYTADSALRSLALAPTTRLPQ
jgi:hypothetical protein